MKSSRLFQDSKLEPNQRDAMYRSYLSLAPQEPFPQELFLNRLNQNKPIRHVGTTHIPSCTLLKHQCAHHMRMHFRHSYYSSRSNLPKNSKRTPSHSEQSSPKDAVDQELTSPRNSTKQEELLLQ